MRPEEMDNNMRDSLKSHVPAWDKAGNWRQIEAALPPKRKRRFLWWFRILGAGLLLAGAGLFLFLPEQEADVLSQTAASSTEKAPYLSPTSSFPTTNQQDGKSPENSSRNSETSYSASSGMPSNTKVKANGIPKSPENSSIPPLAPVLASTDLQTLVEASPSSAPTLLPQAWLPLSPLALRKTSIEYAPPVPEQEEYLFPSSPISRTPRRRPGLSIYGSMSTPRRIFSGIAPEKEPLITERQGREDVLESWQLGLLLDVPLSRRWGVQAGLEWQRINERFRWEVQNSETISIYSDTAYFFNDAQGERQYVGDSVQAVRTETRQVKAYNHFELFNLPLLARYELPVQGWRLRGSAGPILHLHRRFSGVLPDGAGGFLSREEVRQAGVYHNDLAWSLQLQAEVSRPAPWGGEIILGLQYRRGLGSLTSAEAGYRQRYEQFGLVLGWRF